MRLLLALIGLGLIHLPPCYAQTREEKVRNDKKKVESEGFWIYNDLSKGFAEAKKSNKPMLVVFRCIPCEECVKLDDDLIDRDLRIRPLLEKFVCVRVISTNGLDLTQFQFDTDQSFAVFMLHSDGTVYGRFGTRSHRTVWQDDVSVEGLAKAMEAAISLHRDYPKNQAILALKKGDKPEFPIPEKFPQLKGKYKSQLDYQGNVVRSCIHCHQIGDARKQFYLDQKDPLPEKVLFPYPHPKALGMILDPKEKATVLRVEKNSIAQMNGFKPMDVIHTLEGQPLLSLADIQWILHCSSEKEGSLKAGIERDGKMMYINLKLPTGWRRLDDVSWRASSWELRRIATGGMLLKSATEAERKDLRLPTTDMVLRVEHVGQYSPHDVAKKAGFQKGDLIVSFDGKKDLLRETDLLAYSLNHCRSRKKVSVEIVRNGTSVTMTLPIVP